MNQRFQDCAPQLRHLMELAGFSTLKELSEKAGVDELQLIRLRRGLVLQTRVEFLLKISRALGISLEELLAALAPDAVESSQAPPEALALEYKRLQAEMEEQRGTLMAEFQQSSLEILEPWLLQWPTAVYKAKENPQLAATKILALAGPVERLMEAWGLEAIASVGAEVAYNPKLHQLMEGSAEVGAMVRVRFTGYRQGGKLLYRAKVSPL
jgi:transcriptional regulator with XRE-family HTH domain